MQWASYLHVTRIVVISRVSPYVSARSTEHGQSLIEAEIGSTRKWNANCVGCKFMHENKV